MSRPIHIHAIHDSRSVEVVTLIEVVTRLIWCLQLTMMVIKSLKEVVVDGKPRKTVLPYVKELVLQVAVIAFTRGHYELDNIDPLVHHWRGSSRVRRLEILSGPEEINNRY